jgi:hypothetical protein
MEYGNPSGHSMLGPMIYEFFLSNFFLSRGSHSSSSSHSKNKGLAADDDRSSNPAINNSSKKLIRIAMVIFYIFLMATIFFCRIFLGMHAYNQVFLGSTTGIYCIFIYRIFLERYISQIIVFLTIDDKQLGPQGVRVVNFGNIK